MKKRKKTIKSILHVLFMVVFVNLPLSAQFYYGSQVDFGKRKVQYGKFLWSYYQYDKYDVYFYQNGRQLAIHAQSVIEKNLEAIEQKFNTNIDDKFNVLIFNTLSDFNQTNLGTLSKSTYTSGGITYIIGNKIFIYFNGDITNFDTQLLAGLYKLVIEKSVNSTYFKAILTNSEKRIDWFSDGMISYYTDTWTTNTDALFRDLIKSGKVKNLTSTDEKYAVIVGHSVWKYIAEYYNYDLPEEMFLRAIQMSNPYNVFETALGLSFKEFSKAWYNYYSNMYATSGGLDMNLHSSLPIKIKKGELRRIKFSNDGRYLAYSTNESGLKKIFIVDIKNGNKIKRVYKTGFRSYNITDDTYPVFAWHPNSTVLAVATEEKGNAKLFFYDTKSNNIFFPKNMMSSLMFQKILSMSYSADAKSMILSAVKNGRTDIYLLNITSGVAKQITNDIYNDVNPQFIGKAGQIIFSSNRNSGNGIYHDLYKVDLNFPDTVVQLTNTMLDDEINVQPDDDIYYLSDHSGYYNIYRAQFDSAISFVDTATHYNYHINTLSKTDIRENIIDYDILLGKMFFAVKGKEGFKIISGDINTVFASVAGDDVAGQSKILSYKADSVRSAMTNTDSKPLFFNVSEKDKSGDVLTRDKLFGISDNKDDISVQRKEEMSQDERFDKWKNYKPQFFINKLITQIDVSSMNKSYQQFSGGQGPIYMYKGFNVLTGVGVTDLMEDYSITGAISLGRDIMNNEYAVSFSDLSRMVDKEFVFHRFTNITNPDLLLKEKLRTHEVMYKMTYPFTEFFHVGGSIIYRNHRNMRINFGDVESLGNKDATSNWVGLLGTMTYDNTIDLCQNIMTGTRFKVFAEYHQLVTKSMHNLIVTGFDFRNYQRIHREMIFAWRVAGSYSFGTDRLVYYLGGVDNWINPDYNYDLPVADGMDYAYQTIATNLRGHPQNTRNGPNFAVVNAEVRFPVVRYFAKKPLRSKFLNSIQLIGFCDAGSAWNGFNPFSDENSLFNKKYGRTPVHVDVIEQVNPFVVGYGAGVRFAILGYFVRLDYGWDIFGKGTLHISFDMDF